MTLQERLQTDLKKAMRDRDEVRKSVIRFVRAAIHDKEIETQSPLDDEGIITVLVRQAQQRLDSIEAFEQADRQDLVIQRILVRHGVSRDLGVLLLKDLMEALDHLRKHPTSTPLSSEEASGFHH